MACWKLLRFGPGLLAQGSCEACTRVSAVWADSLFGLIGPNACYWAKGADLFVRPIDVTFWACFRLDEMGLYWS